VGLIWSVPKHFSLCVKSWLIWKIENFNFVLFERPKTPQNHGSAQRAVVDAIQCQCRKSHFTRWNPLKIFPSVSKITVWVFEPQSSSSFNFGNFKFRFFGISSVFDLKCCERCFSFVCFISSGVKDFSFFLGFVWSVLQDFSFLCVFFEVLWKIFHFWELHFKWCERVFSFVLFGWSAVKDFLVSCEELMNL
jgi:hypothetical protein